MNDSSTLLFSLSLFLSKPSSSVFKNYTNCNRNHESSSNHFLASKDTDIRRMRREREIKEGEKRKDKKGKLKMNS